MPLCAGTRARKLRFALSYSRAIEGTYDGPCRRVKLGRPARWGKPAVQQSESLPGEQPVGQQESRFPPEQAVIGRWRQATLQAFASPDSCSAVHGSPSSGHAVGQVLGGSQVSPAPMWPSRQVGLQSRSLTAEHPGGQQPSSGMHPVMGLWLQVREQLSIEPDA